MKDYISEFMQDDIQNSIGGAFEADYRRVLFEWQNAKSEKEKKTALKNYIDVLAFEAKYATDWMMALVKNSIDEAGE